MLGEVDEECYLRKIGEVGFIVQGSDMSLKCPNRGCPFAGVSLQSVVVHSVSCSKAMKTNIVCTTWQPWTGM